MTAANSKLMEQVANLNARLQQAQDDALQASDAISAPRAHSNHSEDAEMQLRHQVESLTQQLEQAQDDLKSNQAAGAPQHAQQAAGNTEEAAEIKLLNTRLNKEISELKKELVNAQQAQTGGWAHYSQQALSPRDTDSHVDHAELQQEIADLNAQLQQAHEQLQQAQVAQHAQQAAVANAAEPAVPPAQQLQEVQSQLSQVQESAAAQHAQHEAQTTGDITDLTETNSRLMQQVAELQGQAGKSQREAQHMRELVKAQHAKREEHASSLHMEIHKLQEECAARDIQVSTDHAYCLHYQKCASW